MRAIDADHLKRWILSRVFKTQLNVSDVIDQIDRELTIEPEIVRCKDCKHYKQSEFFPPHMSCNYVINATFIRKPDDFCSRAERRNDDQSK